MRSYKHFTPEEREVLAQLKVEGKKLIEMAEVLGKHVSSISRELRRNANCLQRYTALGATRKYTVRRRACCRPFRILQEDELCQYVQEGLGKYWPPEAIVARWKQKHPQDKLSHSTLYRALRNGLIPGMSPKTHLRRRGTCRYRNRSRFNTITPDHCIGDRPSHIDAR